MTDPTPVVDDLYERVVLATHAAVLMSQRNYTVYGSTATTPEQFAATAIDFAEPIYRRLLAHRRQSQPKPGRPKREKAV